MVCAGEEDSEVGVCVCPPNDIPLRHFPEECPLAVCRHANKAAFACGDKTDPFNVDKHPPVQPPLPSAHAEEPYFQRRPPRPAPRFVEVLLQSRSSDEHLHLYVCKMESTVVRVPSERLGRPPRCQLEGTKEGGITAWMHGSRQSAQTEEGAMMKNRESEQQGTELQGQWASPSSDLSNRSSHQCSARHLCD